MQCMTLYGSYGSSCMSSTGFLYGLYGLVFQRSALECSRARAILRSRLTSLFRLQYAVIGGQAAIFSLLNYGGGGFFD